MSYMINSTELMSDHSCVTLGLSNRLSF